MALAKMSFDELNQLVGYKISEPYDEYFKPMRISEEQKRKREQMAELFDDVFVGMMAELFYMDQYDLSLISQEFMNRIRQEYLDAVATMVIVDEYIRDHAESLVADIIEKSVRHNDDPWFFSEDRARAIAEGESNSIWNYTEYEDAVRNKRWKTWNTIIDGRERESHHVLNGVSIPIDELFEVGSDYMAYPRDFTYDPSPEQYENCRCSLTFS